jgi:hypothetical protein
MEHKTVVGSSSSSAEKPATVDSLLPQQSQLPHIQITLNSPSSSAAPATRLHLILLCFDKDFDSARDAEIWSMEVRASLREKLDHYLIQRTKSADIKLMVCLGPFKSKEEAEQKRPTLSNAMQTPLFTDEVEKTASEQ